MPTSTRTKIGQDERELDHGLAATLTGGTTHGTVTRIWIVSLSVPPSVVTVNLTS